MAKVLPEHRRRKDHAAVLFELSMEPATAKLDPHIPKTLLVSHKAKQEARSKYLAPVQSLINDFDMGKKEDCDTLDGKLKRIVRKPWEAMVRNRENSRPVFWTRELKLIFERKKKLYHRMCREKDEVLNRMYKKEYRQFEKYVKWSAEQARLKFEHVTVAALQDASSSAMSAAIK